MIKTAVLTMSDKGYAGLREDKTGPDIISLIEKYNDGNSYKVEYYKVLPDEKEIIERELCYLCDELKVELILTNGGTGLSSRDVTPEATIEVMEKGVPGISEAMRFESIKITPRSMLSRGVSGIRKNTLIVNLPGSPKGAVENLNVIIDPLIHGIEILCKRAEECAR